MHRNAALLRAQRLMALAEDDALTHPLANREIVKEHGHRVSRRWVSETVLSRTPGRQMPKRFLLSASDSVPSRRQ